MNRLSFQQKLWLPLLASLLCICVLCVVQVLESRAMRFEERKTGLENMDKAALKIVEGYAADASAGRLAADEARRRAKVALGNMRYGQDGYIAIIGTDSTAIQNPGNPSIEGKDMSGFQDPAGLYVFREIARVAGTTAQGGFIQYLWERSGHDGLSTKLSRVVAYKPWGWVLVAGLYVDDIDAAFYTSLKTSAAILAGFCLVLALIVTAVNRSLTRTLGGSPEYAAQVAMRIARHDLSASVQTRPNDTSSLLYAMKVMQDNLAGMIAAIRRSADTIATASSEIASGNLELSARTESQASALEETAASMEQLTQAVAQNADHSAQANVLAASASQVAQRGGAAVSDVVQTMQAIHGSAGRIEAITGVIDGIAFQTNILALNAAVEAARAGEQGRGFAVVATEVRSLAQRSAAAAREIKGLIDDSVRSIANGAGMVRQAGATIDEVVASVSHVTEIIAGITVASNEQRSGIGQVNTAMTEMDGVTQQNAALVEEAAAAAGSLRDQAGALAELVSSFRLQERRPGGAVLALN